jgi:hypothetical protein
MVAMYLQFIIGSSSADSHEVETMHICIARIGTSVLACEQHACMAQG